MPLPGSALHCLLLLQNLCFRVLRDCTKYCSQVGPTFDLFREEAPNVGDVAHITICLAKNLQILGGDKNGFCCICLGWNLQTFEPTKLLVFQVLKEFILPNCNFRGSEYGHILCTIYLINVSVGWLSTFFS